MVSLFYKKMKFIRTNVDSNPSKYFLTLNKKKNGTSYFV